MKNPIIDEAIERILRAESPLTDAKLDGLAAAWAFENSADRGREKGTVLEDVFRVDAAIAARSLGVELAKVSRTRSALPPHTRFYGEAGAMILAWCEAAARDGEAMIEPMLALAREALQAPSRITRAARARVRHGPLRDALACLVYAGEDPWLFEADASSVEARVELMFWHSASAAMKAPELGRWLWGNEAAFNRLIIRGSRGTLRDRALAARILSVVADGFEQRTLPSFALGYTTKVIRALVTHPEPLVWIPAAIAMGRLASRSTDIHDLLMHALAGDNIGEYRRAITSVAVMKSDGVSWSLDHLIERLFKTDPDVWAIASLGPAIPYLAVERRDIFELLLFKLERDEFGPEVYWSATRGLLALAQRGSTDRVTQKILLRLRGLALEAKSRSPAQAQMWLDIRADTDHLVGIDPDPKDSELLLDRAVTSAITRAPEQVWPRAAELAQEIGPNFQLAFSRAAKSEDVESKGAALRIIESCATASALALWQPIASAAGRSSEAIDREAEVDRERMGEIASKALDVAEPDFVFHRAALRVLGYLADATPSASGRGKTSARDRRAALNATIVAGLPWLKAELESKKRFEKAISDVLWRSLDATRSTSLPYPPAVLVVRFCAWWAIACPGGRILDLLRRSEAGSRIDEAMRAQINELEASIRAALDPATEGAINGDTMRVVLNALETLNAGDTALAHVLATFGMALRDVGEARKQPSIDPLALALRSLADVSARLRVLVAGPDVALSEPVETPIPEDTIRELVNASINALQRPGSDTLLVPKRWATGLGPVLGPLLERAVAEALPVAPPPVEAPKPSTPDRIGPYAFRKLIGEGGEAQVWLVEKDNQRLFVLKLLHTRALSVVAEEREKLIANLLREGEMLKNIYHPNVTNFFDSGVDGARAYLVLEYLVGCDLESYADARRLTLEELKPIIADVASGLQALQQAGLVHCDLKPRNIFLRLPLPAGDRNFEPDRHRDPTKMPILAAVVIDFGISRAAAGTGTAGEFGGGTVGYIPPEQLEGRLHRNTDVYALAGVVYRTLTGRRFFDEHKQLYAWLASHATRDPFDDPQRSAELPRALVQLLRDATQLDPALRPDVATFAARFAAL